MNRSAAALIAILVGYHPSTAPAVELPSGRSVSLSASSEDWSGSTLHESLAFAAHEIRCNDMLIGKVYESVWAQGAARELRFSYTIDVFDPGGAQDPTRRPVVISMSTGGFRGYSTQVDHIRPTQKTVNRRPEVVHASAAHRSADGATVAFSFPAPGLKAGQYSGPRKLDSWLR